MSHPTEPEPEYRVSISLVSFVFACVAFVSAVSFFVSFTALAAWHNVVGIPSQNAWAVPVMVDGTLIMCAFAAVLFRRMRLTARVSWSGLWAFSVVSVVANITHAWEASQGMPVVSRLIGATLAALAPIAVLIGTHNLIKILDRMTSRPKAPSQPVVETPKKPVPARRGTTRPRPVSRPTPPVPVVPERSEETRPAEDAGVVVPSRLVEEGPAPVPSPDEDASRDVVPVGTVAATETRNVVSLPVDGDRLASVRAYLASHPDATVGAVSQALRLPRSTAGRLAKQVRDEDLVQAHEEALSTTR